MKIKLYELDLTEEEKEYWRPRYTNNFDLNGKQISVPDEIWKVLEKSGVLVVCFFSQGKETHYDPSRNIWGYDSSGNKLWEIENRFDSMGLEKDPSWFDNYTNMYIKKASGNLRVGTFDGFDGKLDVKTGKVSDWEQGK